ncbi:hypothetical protein M9Y10_039532 [Tritrichomonas musculus]|uniref:14-3-3 domain-containing protein n=1 Tax=Tritrichomonas musculus TaxID=1915356 RepID=A0ABR2KEN2_9EUKA
MSEEQQQPSKADDLLFLADLMKRIQRPKDGLELMEELANLKPSFNEIERSSFGAIFKAAVDNIRSSLRVLTDNLINEEEKGNTDFADNIKQVINETFSDLQKLCNRTLKIIDDCLLPNAESVKAKVFFLKLKGDIFRYISEYAEGEEKEKALSGADEAYLAAIPLSKSDLVKSDPVRLGLILNFAVFKYEHMQAHEEAKELLTDAIGLVKDDFSDLSNPDTVKEAESIIEVMQSNLENWDEMLGEDEEEDEES